MSLSLSNHKRCFSAYTLIPGGGMLCTQNAAFREVVPEEAVTSSVRRARCEEEKMFEKSLTPSDVGKLNRLVIPKQNAEKYFPLKGGSVDSGVLLGFEDECGKAWRFRYSYWNSSQSYVLTKGWSRFVKDKKLGAGDVVQFARHRMDIGRFFIGWRRRNSDGGAGSRPSAYQTRQYFPSSSTTTSVEKINGSGDCVADEQPIRNGNSKRMRLFGVNLECPEDDSDAAETSTQHHSFTDHQRTWI